MTRNSEIEAFAERPLCNAPTKSGGPCQSRAMRNSTRCRSHGGNTPAAIDAARVRALRQADPLMAKLHAIAFDDTKPPAVQLEAIKHAIKVTGAFETKQGIELEVVGAPREKTFLDFVGDALVDVEEDDDEPLPAIEYPDVVDAEVVTDDEPPLLTRHDRAAFAEVERSRERRVRPGGMTDEQRARAEAQAMAELKRSDAADRQADVDRDREAMLLAKANGTWNPSSRGDAMREAAKTDEQTGKRRARVTDATFSEDRRRKRRRE